MRGANREGREREEEEEDGGDQASQGMELLTLCMDPWFCWLMVYPKPRV